MSQLQEIRIKIFRVKNQEVEPNRTICERIFGWDYNTWCRCHYCGEFGHIGKNCVKNHMRKKTFYKEIFYLYKTWTSFQELYEHNKN